MHTGLFQGRFVRHLRGLPRYGTQCYLIRIYFLVGNDCLSKACEESRNPSQALKRYNSFTKPRRPYDHDKPVISHSRICGHQVLHLEQNQRLINETSNSRLSKESMFLGYLLVIDCRKVSSTTLFHSHQAMMCLGLIIDTFDTAREDCRRSISRSQSIHSCFPCFVITIMSSLTSLLCRRLFAYKYCLQSTFPLFFPHKAFVTLQASSNLQILVLIPTLHQSIVATSKQARQRKGTGDYSRPLYLPRL